jgi:hypothetical protein
MQLFLQAWGGMLFLISKALFWSSERASTEVLWRRRRMWAWSCYLIGITPWLIIFWQNHNWIAMGIEISGIPSLVLGLFLAIKGRKSNIPRWFDSLALALGFLYGTYRLAKDQIDGYYGYMVMNVANACLMGIQDKDLLMAQQIVSFLIVCAAYLTKRNKQKNVK